MTDSYPRMRQRIQWLAQEIYYTQASVDTSIANDKDSTTLALKLEALKEEHEEFSNAYQKLTSTDVRIPVYWLAAIGASIFWISLLVIYVTMVAR